MQKEILAQILTQNRNDCFHFCNSINNENIDFRLTEQAASIGFIYRHLGETINLIGQFFGYSTTVEGSTLGQKDTGKYYDLETSRLLFEQGYNTFEKLISETSDREWLQDVETTWFGKISRIRLFSLALFHNSHHCGQISMTILKGKKTKQQ